MLDVVDRKDGGGRPYWPNQYVTVKEMQEIKELLRSSNIKKNALGNTAFFDTIRSGHFPRLLNDAEEAKMLKTRAQNIYDFYNLANAAEPNLGENIENVNFWTQGLSVTPKKEGEILPGGFARNNVKALLNRFAETADEATVKALGISVDQIKEIVDKINQTILTNNKSIER